MKSVLLNSVWSLILILGIASCSSSENVVSNNFLQKRKYNKGFHKRTNQNLKFKSNELEARNHKQDNFLEINNELKQKIESPENMIKTQKAVSSSSVKIITVDSETIASNEAPKKVTSKNLVSKKVLNTINKITKKKSNISSVKHLNQNTDDSSIVLLYVLCFFIPFLAVGIVTDWNMGAVLLNILLTLLLFLPGLIHALVVVSKNK